MRNTTLPLILLICCVATFGQQDQQPNSQRAAPPQGMCAAAAPKLRESATNKVVLTMIVDATGRVQSFTTESPKGLRLEKMKEPAAAIKAMHFKEPARKDGRAVMVMVRAEFDCSGSATDAAQKQYATPEADLGVLSVIAIALIIQRHRPTSSASQTPPQPCLRKPPANPAEPREAG